MQPVKPKRTNLLKERQEKRSPLKLPFPLISSPITSSLHEEPIVATDLWVHTLLKTTQSSNISNTINNSLRSKPSLCLRDIKLPNSVAYSQIN
jgi:hypothetical protein